MTQTPGDESEPQPEEPTRPLPPPAPQPGYCEQQAQQPPAPPGWGQQPGYPPPPGYPQQPMYYAPAPPDHPRATLAMVLGILSLVCCQLTGPFAWVIGAKAVREIDAARGALGGRGQALAGKICGIIGSVLLVLAVIYLVFLVVLAFNQPDLFDDTYNT